MKKTLKVYFCGSIRGSEADREKYFQIIQELKKRYIVLTEHVGDKKMLEDEKMLSDEEIYIRDMNWIKEADVVIAEISAPSHGVGVEITEAKHLGKVVFCFYQSDVKISAMIAGDKKLSVISYSTVGDLIKTVEDFAVIYLEWSSMEFSSPY